MLGCSRSGREIFKREFLIAHVQAMQALWVRQTFIVHTGEPKGHHRQEWFDVCHCSFKKDISTMKYTKQ